MTETRTTSPAELLVELRRDADVALHRQLEQRLRESIQAGRLKPGSSLPSSRTLARELGLARGVVVEAYEQLVAEGYLTSRHGSGTKVSDRALEGTVPSPAPAAQPAYRFDFGYGRPDVTAFPRNAWLRSIRRILAYSPADRLGYIDARGVPELRGALADYLNRVRGTSADVDDIVVTNGFSQALDLVIGVLRADGITRVGVEEPGHRDAPGAAARHGLEAVPIAVDEQGIRVDMLAASGVRAVVVTPAHQLPTGAVLGAERRVALAHWARLTGSFIVEDDYDAEFRYDRDPVGALQGLAPAQVVYAGSASKTLAPGLRLGWLIAPHPLVDRLASEKRAVDRGSPSLDQLAFADFLERGEFDHHLRRMRGVYRRRRDLLLTALRRHTPQLRPAGASAGLHVVAWLPPGVDEAAVAAAAGARSVRVGRVGTYRLVPGGPAGLLFGYGTIADGQIDEGVRLIADALREAGAGPG